MAGLKTSLVSSSARRLPWRMRPDLTARKHRYQGDVYWVVKEPVGLHYYRFQDEEYALLEMLDGETNLDDLKEKFEARFPPQKITVEELGQFVGMLHRSNLLVSDAPGQGVQLRKRGDERRREEVLNMLSNVLAIRFKGIDPERLLNWLYPKIRWFFTPTAVVFCCLAGLAALMLVGIQFDNFLAKLPTFDHFFKGWNWLYLGAALCVTKILHEFGHGLSCKHFGGECHEMGVLMLVLTPCLYCNVSDSWMLPNKWSRAAIGAAGMYVELVIATWATFIWWFTAPETLLNQLCLSTMFVCSVSTLVFNGNPLLRYDGYYILADIVEIPNLRQKATSILGRKLGWLCLGLEETEDPFLPQRNQIFFAIYSVAATIYSWIVAFSILFFLNKVFKPYRLEVLGQLIALGAVYGLFVQPLWKVGKFMWVPGRVDSVKKPRLYVTLGVLAAVLLFVFLVPLPYRVMCSFEIKPRNAESVYVDVPGTLEQINVTAGERVTANKPLAVLANPDVRIAAEELKGKKAQLEAQYEALWRQRYTTPQAGEQLAQVKESLDSIDKELSDKDLDLGRLTLLAPIAGVVMPPPAMPARTEDDSRLPSWTGTPLERKNLGASLKESSLFCQIGDPTQWEAILVVDQADVDLVHEQQRVDIKLDQLPAETLEGQISEISKSDLKVAPRQLSSTVGGDLVTRTDANGVQRPVAISYQALVPLDDPREFMLTGLRGRAKIHADYQTIWERSKRYFSQTFNFKL